MALPVLDGNQSATTLSSVVTGGEHIVAHSVVSLGTTAIANIASAVSGSVVSISNFPSTQTIAGTVTANVGDASNLVGGGYANLVDLFANESLQVSQTGTVVVDSINNPISGTVTASLNENTIIEGGTERILGTNGGFTLSGGVGLAFNNGSAAGVVGTNSPLPISGTVTANNPNGPLTTRFGSVTTANTAQITSAVTNTSRKYLLAQNISTGTVTIGIGFSPTTTQGIQLTAGAGLTFDAFCPTGAVYWLGATTGATWTILEG